VWELDRMGAFRGRGLAVPLLMATLALLVLEASFVFSGLPRVTSPLRRRAWQYGLCIVSAALFALLAPVPSGGRERPRGAVWLAAWLLPPLFSLVVVDDGFGGTRPLALILLP